MDIKSESESLRIKDIGLGELRNKIGFSDRALKKLRKEIENVGEMSVEKATNYAFRLLELEVENNLLHSDAMAIEIELSNDDEFKSSRKEDYDATIKPMREAEAVLLDASRGDYRKVKKYIKEGANYANESANEGDYGRGLSAIVDLIPDSGQPFKPSVPSWMEGNLND